MRRRCAAPRACRWRWSSWRRARRAATAAAAPPWTRWRRPGGRPRRCSPTCQSPSCPAPPSSASTRWPPACCSASRGSARWRSTSRWAGGAQGRRIGQSHVHPLILVKEPGDGWALLQCGIVWQQPTRFPSLPCLPASAPCAVQAGPGGQHPCPQPHSPLRDPPAGAGGGACHPVPLPPHPHRAGHRRLHLRRVGAAPGPQAVRPRRAHGAGRRPARRRAASGCPVQHRQRIRRRRWRGQPLGRGSHQGGAGWDQRSRIVRSLAVQAVQ